MFKKVLEYTGEYKRTTYLAIIILMIGTLCNVLPYLFIYQLIKPLLMHETLDLETIAFNIAGALICLVLHACFYVKGLVYSHVSAYHTLKNLRISLQKRMEGLPLGVIQEKGIGSMKKMFIDDIETIELLLAHTIPEGIANLSIPVIVYIVMFFIDIKLGLLSLASLPIGMLAMGVMYKIGMKGMKDYYEAAANMNNMIIEYVNGMEVVKVFNRDGESYHRFEQNVRGYRNFTLAWFKACWPWMALYSSILPCVVVLTLPLGTYFVLQGYSTLPDLILILCLSFSIGAPLLKAMTFGGTLPQLNYKIEHLEQMFHSEPLKQSPKSFEGSNHTIQFDNVHFAYQQDEVLHGVSLQIKEGTQTALVGESGSGKSTLAKLLVHFYDIHDGTITIGGQSITDMSIEALNQHIAYVSQEQFLFHTTLFENIHIGNLEASEEEVLEAARKAQCNEFLKRLDQGIYTLAGDGGKQLSGGERQRIALARAILKNASIIVLDEATAFVDPENEEKMNLAIAEIIKDKTVIVIAHRLHSIIHADQICVLKDGCIDGIGTHEALLHTSKEYQKLWNASKVSASWKIRTDIGGAQA